MRIAIIGDVGGHSGALREALNDLGIDCASGTVPDDLVAVQVGDLVHKGPDSVGVLALVDRLLAARPGAWIQLLGNHEASYLGGPEFWSEPLARDQRSDLERWGEDGLLSLAVACETEELGDVLVTHAGLSRWRWQELGRPGTAAGAARAINAQLLADREAALRWSQAPGCAGLSSGVCWTEPSRLVAGWLPVGGPPFSQVVGHCPLHDATTMTWTVPTSPRVAEGLAFEVLEGSGHGRVVFPAGTSVTSVDRGHYKTAQLPLDPLVLTLRTPPVR